MYTLARYNENKPPGKGWKMVCFRNYDCFIIILPNCVLFVKRGNFVEVHKNTEERTTEMEGIKVRVSQFTGSEE